MLTVHPGDPVGHFLGPTGTVGLKVRRIGDDALLLLSCSHVLARCGYAKPGDIIKTATGAGDLILNNPIGQLDLCTVLSQTVQNDGDFALSTIDGGVSAQAEILEIGLPKSVLSISALGFNAYRNVTVHRFGAACKYRLGIIQGYLGPVCVRGLPTFGSALVEFTNAVAYTTLSDYGDSGAAVVSPTTGQVFGIHIGGDPVRRIGYFCPVGEFMNRFGLELAVS